MTKYETPGSLLNAISCLRLLRVVSQKRTLTLNNNIGIKIELSSLGNRTINGIYDAGNTVRVSINLSYWSLDVVVGDW